MSPFELSFELLTCTDLVVSEICPDINVGIIHSGDHRFVVQLMYAKPEELIKFGVKFDDIRRCLFAKTYTSIRIKYVEPEEKVEFVKTDDETISSDRVVFHQYVEAIRSPEALNRVNNYVSLLISREIGDLNIIYNFIKEIIDIFN